MSKLDELNCLVVDVDPDILLICETWCNSDIDNAILSLPGYDLINDLRRDRTDTYLGKGGGLLVYAKPSICISPCDNIYDFNQYCRFEVLCGNEKWLLTVLYRPPSSPPENCELLLKLLEQLPVNSLLVGDFNYPYINWSDHTATTARGKNFINKCDESLLEQLVTFPTHIKGNVLDLVLCNNSEKILNISNLGRLGKSDHVTIQIEIAAPRQPAQREAAKPVWGRADWQAMRSELSQLNWEENMKLMNTNESWNYIKSKLDKVVQQHVPTRPWKATTRPPWMSTELLRNIRNKRRLWTQHKRQNTASSLAKYKEAEKLVSKKIKDRKSVV